MIKISNNKAVFLNVMGEYTTYSKKTMKGNEEIVKDFAKKFKHPDKGIDELCKKGYIIFMVDEDKTACYMPSSLSDYQLYELDLLCLGMDDIKLMDVYKNSTDDIFNLSGNVCDAFSSIVIQSYFEKPKQKVK